MAIQEWVSFSTRLSWWDSRSNPVSSYLRTHRGGEWRIEASSLARAHLGLAAIFADLQTWCVKGFNIESLEGGFCRSCEDTFEQRWRIKGVVPRRIREKRQHKFSKYQ